MNWLENPLVWIALLPALAATGVLYQMVMGLFSCCGTFRLQGRSIRLRWWMIPALSSAAALLWTVVIILAVFTDVSL
ncbi:competence protein ComEC [Salidesulfovibrio onnuriiensis]|uniref:competence protein ComEC n=1 Tax=Salidesulfovibrio onnuriiensis TaxID=2583823 RepID=UPI00164F499C|nr:competence protein ComEC [Salidesulfovibrio onnuriiensis]